MGEGRFESQKWNEMATINQIVSEITNDLRRLIPLGVLLTVNIPGSPALPAEAPDGWRWLDVPYLSSNIPLINSLGEQCSFTAIIQDLCYLIERLWIRVTYKTIKMKQTRLTCLRVYAIPRDIENGRYMERVRSRLRFGKPLGWNVSKYKAIMKKLISVLDYSKVSWDFQWKSYDYLVFNALKPFDKFNTNFIGINNYVEDGERMDHHLARLTMCQRYRKSNKSTSETLESRLTDVYNTLEFKINKASQYYQEVQHVKGMKSTLLNYQTESVSKMLERESQSSKQLMPHLLHFQRQDRDFYLNTIDLTFNESPEYYSTPRGGILAENMGLGKTCICLALIVHTKYEFSEIPERFTIDKITDFKVRSLFEQSARAINQRSIPWKSHLDVLPVSCVKKLESSPGYFYFKRYDISAKKTLSRSRPIIREEKLLLSSTTLIVCPDNLFNQWEDEIRKHVHEGVLTVLKLIDPKMVPLASTLVKFDVILMSNSVYISENPAVSELSKVYWKRFIIDEGHTMNQRSTRAVALSKSLKIERRWAVTGTPTSGMTKLHMNESSGMDNSNEYTVKRSYNPRDDLSRMGSLITNFFQIEPFSTQNHLWTKNIVKPFIDNIHGSEYSLTSMLDSIIIRHSNSQVDNDVTLPLLFHKPVFLDPSFHNKLSVNLFTAVLAINAVSSEREDRDYMFHRSNKADLARLVTNLQRATFYWTGFSIDDLDSMLFITKACINKKNEDGSNYYNDQDMELLKRSVKNCKMALSDTMWRLMTTVHEMSYYVDGLDKEYHDNFGIGKNGEISIFGAPQLYSLQKFFFRHRFLDGENLSLKLNEESSVFWEDYWREAAKKNAERAKKNDGQAIEIPKVNEELDRQEKLLLKFPKKLPTKFEDPQVVRNAGGRIYFGSHSNTPGPKNDTTSAAKILGTASAKLSYMVSRLLEHEYSNIKSIVFFEFEDSAYYLSEALDLLGINYTLYATSVHKNERHERISRFKTSQYAHCLVMDIKLASHGLTITEATRVYFLSPVWKKSVEAQAIKRAHRIGQTSNVHVETLILKGTLEEEMFKKRLSTADEKEVNIAVSDDAQIQEYITKFGFLKVNQSDPPYSELKSENCSGLTKLNHKEFEPNELLEHTGYIGKDKMTHWSVALFSKEAQGKMSQMNDNRPVNIINRTSDVERYSKRETTRLEKDQRINIRTLIDEDNDDETNADEQRPKKKVRFT